MAQHDIVMAAAGAVSTGYQISRSLRFNSADGTSFDRTPSSATNRQTFTISFWAKNASTAGAITTFYAAGSDTNNNETVIGYWDGLYVQNSLAGASWRIRTAAVYRDPSAWYHFIFAFDLGNATQANRLKIYVNGVESTYAAADGNPLPSTANSMVDANVIQYIGRRAYSSTGQTTNAYMAEFYLIDGQQLTPSSFGQTDAQTGVWGPKAYSGSYGTNGFYLNFSDNSNTTAATLGKDYSGNGNNWTPNNFSVSAGAGNDSLVDSPTSYGTDTGVGGNVRGNYCTLNPLNAGSTATLSNGNLDTSDTATATTSIAYATIGVSAGKWYWEVVGTSGGAYMIGISKDVSPRADWQTTNGFAYFSSNGQKYTNSAGAAYGATFTTNDVIGVALDMDAGTLVFYKNGVSQGTAFSGLSGTYFPSLQNPGASSTQTFNFGQRPFAYTAPSGYKALCTQNLPTPAVGATAGNRGGNHFNAITFTGDSANPRSFTGFGFSPDLIWSARRDVSYGIQIFDSVRGVGKRLNTGYPSLATAAEDSGYGLVNSFDADGYSSNAVDQASNYSGGSYITWAWNAGESTVSNTAGSITSSVRANTTAGISILTYTGTGSLATVGHGLGVAPSMIIAKGRSPTSSNWTVYHQAIGNTNSLQLNLSNSVYTAGSVWNNTSPTSSVFTISTDGGVNLSGQTYVAYCFAEVQGFSKFGTYQGNGSADGTFVYCGFRPAFIITKSSSNASNWLILDAKRNTYNVVDKYLTAENTPVEGTFTFVDFTSNGFKIRSSDTSINGGDPRTYIFMAFAEAPFKYALAR